MVEEKVWQFNFILESEDGTPLSRDVAEHLLDNIIGWAETRGCQLGGGYHAPRDEELDEPLFKLD